MTSRYGPSSDVVTTSPELSASLRRVTVQPEHALTIASLEDGPSPLGHEIVEPVGMCPQPAASRYTSETITPGGLPCQRAQLASTSTSVHGEQDPRPDHQPFNGGPHGGARPEVDGSNDAHHRGEQLTRLSCPPSFNDSPTTSPSVPMPSVVTAMATEDRPSPPGGQLALPQVTNVGQPRLPTADGHPSSPSGGQLSLSHPPLADQPALSLESEPPSPSGGQPSLPRGQPRLLQPPSNGLTSDQPRLSSGVNSSAPSAPLVGQHSLPVTVRPPGTPRVLDQPTLSGSRVMPIVSQVPVEVRAPVPTLATDPRTVPLSNRGSCTSIPTRDGPIAAGVPRAFREELQQQQHSLPTPYGSVPYPRNTGTISGGPGAKALKTRSYDEDGFYSTDPIRQTPTNVARLLLDFTDYASTKLSSAALDPSTDATFDPSTDATLDRLALAADLSEKALTQKCRRRLHRALIASGVHLPVCEFEVQSEC